jgi:hypothetical protein
MKLARWKLGLLSVAALLVSAYNAEAGLFHCWGCGHGCCDVHICCRPYNAFTPVCCGNLTCDGCCPLSCQGGNTCLGPIACAMSPFGPGCDGGSCMAGAAPYLGGMPASGLTYGAPIPVPNGQQPTGTPPNGWAPMPNAAPMPNGTPPPAGAIPPGINHTAQYFNPALYYGYGYGYGVQPVNYYGYPGYYGYYPQAWPNPYYGYYGYGQQRPW